MPLKWYIVTSHENVMPKYFLIYSTNVNGENKTYIY